MTELVATFLGGGFTLAAAGYMAGAGFIARHKNVHVQQVVEVKRHIAEFEEAYKREEVTERNWEQFLAICRESVLSCCSSPSIS